MGSLEEKQAGVLSEGSRGGKVVDHTEAVEHKPGLGERSHNIPEARPLEAVFSNQTELGFQTAGVFEPDLVNGAPGVGVVEKGALGVLVVLYGYVVLPRQFNCPLVGD